MELPGWDDFAPDSGFDSADTPCPHCVAANAADTTPEWTQYTGTGETFSSGTRHIYIDNDEKVLNLTAQIKLSGGTTVVWIKPGVSVIGASNANVFRAQGGDLWVLGGSGSVVTGPGNASGHYNGGLMRVMNANSDVHIYGDVTIQLNRENNEVTGSSAMGGLVDVYSGNLYMRDGTMIGPVDASSGVVRGAVAITNTTGNFYMSGGRMKGSGVNEASPISFHKAGKVEISGDAYIEGYSGAASAGGGYAIYQTVAGTVNIKGGTIKGGTVTGEHTIDGSAIYLNAGNVNISDGTVYGGTATNGGAIYVAGGATTITGGTVYGGTATNGGAIYVADGTLTMQSDANNANGGIVNGSVAEKGGAIYLDENATFTLTKGTVNGCSITNETTTVVKGGAIYSVATGETAVQLNGGTINGGTIARAANTEQGITALNGSGGAIYVGGGYLNMDGTTISGGVAYNGGSVYVLSGTAKLTGGSITGGDAFNNGGCIYLSYETNDDKTISAGAFQMTEGSVTKGHAKQGGNVYVASRTTFNMEGGSISGGYTNSTSNGGAVYVYGSSSDDTIDGVFNMSGGTVTVDGSKSGYSKGMRIQDGALNLSGDAEVIAAGGGATGAGIDLLRGRLTLDGNARIYTPSGKTTYDILVRESNGSKVTVLKDWTGSSTVRFNHMTKEGATDTYAPGSVISSDFGASTGDYSGELYLASESTLPRIYGKNGNLVFSDVAVVDAAGMTWCKDNAEALTVCDNNEDRYIKLFNSALTMDGETVRVDFNGKTAEVTGSGTLYGFDSSAGTDGAGTAKVAATGVTVEPFITAPVSGESFIAITQGNDTTFHIIKPIIESVSLRPGTAGVYYSGKVICDSTLAAYVKAYGVAVALNDMPGDNFRTTSMYTEENKALTSAGSFNGVLVNQIMKDESGVDNNSRADFTICANAYVTVAVNGEEKTYLSSFSDDAASMSLKTLVGKINAIYRTLSDTQHTALNDMYTVYRDEMLSRDENNNPVWRINNIAGACGDDVFANDEDGLKILMIGNSLSVDAGRMLAYVFHNEGYENIRISTLYHSGCKLNQHVEYLTDNEVQYRFYNSQYTTKESAALTSGSLVPSNTTTSKYTYTMLQGIQEDDWDIIVMQQGSAEAAYADTYNEDLQTIIDYVLENDIDKTTRPSFIWNSIWGYPYNADELASNGSDYVTLLKRITGSDTADAAAQIKMVDMITQAAKDKILTNDNFAYVIPSGTAFIRACAGLGNGTAYYDYIHASDLSRLMISYVWFSAITGKEVTDLPDAIPAALLRSGSDNRTLTVDEKTVILDSISKAFTDPYTMPTTLPE